MLNFHFHKKYLPKPLPLVFGCLLVLSLASIVLIYKNTNEKNLLDQSLLEKEARVESLNIEVKNLLRENKTIRSTDSAGELLAINNTLDKYNVVKEKATSYKASGVDVATAEADLPKVVDSILAKKYTDADILLTKIDTDLETALKTKQAADAAAKPKSSSSTSSSTCTSVPSSGYCKMTIKASSGSFTTDIIAANLGSVTVVTDAANDDDCDNNCPTKSLQTYVKDNGGYAGINGTYFCPPDYSSCSGKTNSYDFPVYDSNLKKWLNQSALSSNNALLAFSGGSATFYKYATSYSGLSGIKAGISNFPGLVQNGANIVSSYSLTSAQNTKGTRGGIGIKGSTIYLVVARSASVNDLANVMLAIGASEALNIDGGGSSALYYNGSYKLGPGRSLPNALILK